MKKTLNWPTLALFTFALLWRVSDNSESDAYRAYFYPDRDDLSEVHSSPDFRSPDEARDWVNRMVTHGGFDYEIARLEDGRIMETFR